MELSSNPEHPHNPFLDPSAVVGRDKRINGATDCQPSSRFRERNRAWHVMSSPSSHTYHHSLVHLDHTHIPQKGKERKGKLSCIVPQDEVQCDRAHEENKNCVCVCVCGGGSQVEPTHLWSGSVDETSEKQAKEQEESLATLDVMTREIATALPQQTP